MTAKPRLLPWTWFRALHKAAAMSAQHSGDRSYAGCITADHIRALAAAQQRRCALSELELELPRVLVAADGRRLTRGATLVRHAFRCAGRAPAVVRIDGYADWAVGNVMLIAAAFRGVYDIFLSYNGVIDGCRLPARPLPSWEDILKHMRDPEGDQ